MAFRSVAHGHAGGVVLRKTAAGRLVLGANGQGKRYLGGTFPDVHGLPYGCAKYWSCTCASVERKSDQLLKPENSLDGDQEVPSGLFPLLLP